MARQLEAERSPTSLGEVNRGAIEIRNLSKAYRRRSGARVSAVNDLSLIVRQGEITAVVGPSGCGKTTLLRCVAGLERPDRGTITIDGVVVSDAASRKFVQPEARGIGMMFQTYALWPHMTVGDNVGYPLRARSVPRSEAKQRVRAVLEKVGLGGLEDEHPSRLSGGQQQRVALARSLVAEPKVILFDEPLSNVDARVREDLRVELVRMHREHRFTGLYVTHDQEEALQIGSRLAVLRDGRIEQEGPTVDVYQAPASTYVAEFLGATNTLPGTVTSSESGPDGPTLTVETRLGPIVVAADRSGLPGPDVDVIVRPNDVSVHIDAPGARPNVWPGTVVASMFRGTWTQHLIDVRGTTLKVWTDRGLPAGTTDVWVAVDPGNAMALRRG